MYLAPIVGEASVVKQAPGSKLPGESYLALLLNEKRPPVLAATSQDYMAKAGTAKRRCAPTWGAKPAGTDRGRVPTSRATALRTARSEYPHRMDHWHASRLRCPSPRQSKRWP